MCIMLDAAVQAPGIARVSLLFNEIIYVSLGVHKPVLFFPQQVVNQPKG